MADAGGKYVLTFSVEGAGESQLEEIARLLKNVSEMAGDKGANRSVQALERALRKLEKGALAAKVSFIELSAQLDMLENGMNRIKGAADWFAGLSEGVLRGAAGLARGMMNTISPLESSITTMKVMGKMSDDQARGALKSVSDLVAATPFLTQELNSVTEALVLGKVKLGAWKDAAGQALTYGGLTAKGMTKLSGAALEMAKNVNVSALSVVADFAALTGNVGPRMQFFVSGLQRMFTTKSSALLRDQVQGEALRAMVGGVGMMRGKAEDAIKRMYEYLKKKNAVGMAALASSTAEGVMSNFKEIPSLIFKAIGGDPLDQNSPYNKLKQGFANMFSSIAVVINDPKNQANLQKAIGPIIEMMGSLGTVIGKVASAILEFAAAYPTLTKYIAGLTLIGSIGTLVISKLVSVAASIGLATIGVVSFRIAMVKLMPVLTAFATRALVALAPFAIIAAKVLLVVGALTAVGYAIKRYVQANEPLRKAFEDIGAVLSATWEALSNWSGKTTTISRETADKLKKAGLLDTFLQLVKNIRAVELAAKQVWSAFRGPMVSAFEAVIGVFGNFDDKVKNNIDTMKNSKDTAEVLSAAVRTGFQLMIDAVGGFAEGIAEAYSVWTWFAGAMKTGVAAIVAVIDGMLSMVWRLVSGLGSLMEAAYHLQNGDYDKAKASASAGYNSITNFADMSRQREGLAAVADEAASDIKRADDILARVRAFKNTKIAGEVEATGTGPDGEPILAPVPTRTRNSLPASSSMSGGYEDEAAGMSVPGAMTGTRRGSSKKEIHAHTHLYLDGKKIAEAVTRHQEDESDRSFSPRYPR